MDALGKNDEFLEEALIIINPNSDNKALLDLFHSFESTERKDLEKEHIENKIYDSERYLNDAKKRYIEIDNNLQNNTTQKDEKISTNIWNNLNSVNGFWQDTINMYWNQKEVSSNKHRNHWELKDAIESGLPVRLTGTDIVVHKVNDTTLSVKWCGDEWPAHKANEIPWLFRRIEACASIPFLRNHFLPGGWTFFTDIYDKINRDPAFNHLKDQNDQMVPSYKFAALLLEFITQMVQAPIIDGKIGNIGSSEIKSDDKKSELVSKYDEKQPYPESLATLGTYQLWNQKKLDTAIDRLETSAPMSQIVKNGTLQKHAFYEYFVNNIQNFANTQA